MPVVLLFGLLVALPVVAGIYKSVDEDGNVTYSSQPPADSVQVDRVDVAPPPTEEQRRSARERQQRISTEASSMARDREKREKVQREAERKAAQQEAAEAQRQADEQRRREDNYFGYPGLWYPIPRPLPGQPGRPLPPDRPIMIPQPGGGGRGVGPGAGAGFGHR